jgi:hypothetical protein
MLAENQTQVRWAESERRVEKGSSDLERKTTSKGISIFKKSRQSGCQVLILNQAWAMYILGRGSITLTGRVGA